MDGLGHLEEMLLEGKITMEEYVEKKDVYVETLLQLYLRDIITKEQFYERVNK